MNKEEKLDIEWKKCKNCGFLQHNTHLRCLRCKNGTFSTVYPSGPGQLISYTILKAPPIEFRNKESYALGIIEFSNGIRAMGQITECTDLTIGMKLKPIYKTICDNLDGESINTYVFEPI